MKLSINYLQPQVICLDVHLNFLLNILARNSLNLLEPLRRKVEG